MNLCTRLVVVMLVILAGLAVPAAAFAHGDGESEEAAALAAFSAARVW